MFVICWIVECFGGMVMCFLYYGMCFFFWFFRIISVRCNVLLLFMLIV